MPLTGVLIVVSIFMASRTITVSSSFISEPSEYSILKIFPLSGALITVPVLFITYLEAVSLDVILFSKISGSSVLEYLTT